MLDNKSILITGGTGSLGNALVERILTNIQTSNASLFFRRAKTIFNEPAFSEKIPALRYLLETLEILNA